MYNGCRNSPPGQRNVCRPGTCDHRTIQQGTNSSEEAGGFNMGRVDSTILGRGYLQIAFDKFTSLTARQRYLPAHSKKNAEVFHQTKSEQSRRALRINFGRPILGCIDGTKKKREIVRNSTSSCIPISAFRSSLLRSGSDDRNLDRARGGHRRRWRYLDRCLAQLPISTSTPRCIV